MADRDFAEYGVPGAFAPGKAQRLVQMAGAASSVVLVVALGVWGYRLAVRDIAGVPVIRALEGPARTAPEDPGGAVADHQGLAVNDVVAEGTAAPPAERLVLAPKPVELTLEDGPGLADGLPPAEAEVQPASMAVPAAMVPAAGGAEDDAVAAALAEALGIEPEAVETGVETAALDAAGQPAPEGAITRSPRPMPRPDHGTVVQTAAAIAPPVEVDPSTLKPGTRLVQFGAFDSPDQAKEHWGKLSATFGELMVGKAQVIQSAESGGRTFYRLRAEGFTDEADARRFCAAVTAVGPECIPVAVR